jgi:orotidine-5'-phosphate decarboxylase
MPAPVKSKLIVALDVDTLDAAAAVVRELGPLVEIYKVGSQLFTRVGPSVIEFLRDQGRQVFLDLKFHDIPHTVANAVAAAAAHRVMMLTVHAAGGEEMLRAAAAVAARPRIVAVTVLTSHAGNVTDEVLARARLALAAGLDGVVASPREVSLLRQQFGPDFLIVTPGIRPAGAEAGDQKRILTPAEAVKAGASYIVVGRPILAARHRAAAARRLLAEMAG